VLNESGRVKHRFVIRNLLADKRCSQAVLEFLSTTDVGRLVWTEEDARSETTKWELRELRERGDERRAEAEELGAAGGLSAGEELPLFLPTPSFMSSVDEGWGRGTISFVISFRSDSLFCESLWCDAHFLGQAWVEGKGELPTCRLAWTADGKPGQNVRRHSLARLNASVIKEKKSEQQPDKTVAGSSKRTASRFYLLKPGHCLTGQYLEWTKNQPTAKYWWCEYKLQAPKHVPKNCPKWGEQQKVVWGEIWEEAGRGRDRFRIRDLQAHLGCASHSALSTPCTAYQTLSNLWESF